MAKKTLLLTESDFQALKTNGSVEVVPVPAQNTANIGFARFADESIPVRAEKLGTKISLATTEFLKEIENYYAK